MTNQTTQALEPELPNAAAWRWKFGVNEDVIDRDWRFSTVPLMPYGDRPIEPLYTKEQVLSAIAADRNRREDAPVSAGLSKQEILDIAAKVAYLSNTAPDESIIEFARALEARLLVPEGWVSVPREPTEAMKQAGYHAPYKPGLPDPYHAITIYKAMIAAAPSIEVQAKPMPGQGEG